MWSWIAFLADSWRSYSCFIDWVLLYALNFVCSKTNLSSFMIFLPDEVLTICSFSWVMFCFVASYVHVLWFLFVLVWNSYIWLSGVWLFYYIMLAFLLLIFVSMFIVGCIQFVWPFGLLVSSVYVIPVWLLAIMISHLVCKVLLCWYLGYFNMSCKLLKSPR